MSGVAQSTFEPGQDQGIDGGEFARIDLDSMRNSISLVADFSPIFLRDAGLYPHRTETGQVRLALCDPTRKDAIDAILLTLPPPVELRIARADEIELMLDSLAHQDQEADERQSSATTDSGYEED